MSGGSHGYAYRRVEEMADRLARPDQSALRRAFAEHLRLVAGAMHDVEWVDSCDYSPGREDEAIRAVLGQHSNRAELEMLVADAMRARDALDAALVRADAAMEVSHEGK